MRAFLILAKLRLLEVFRSPSFMGFFWGFPVGLLLIVGFIFINGHPFEQRYVLIVDSIPAPERTAHPLVQAMQGVEEIRLEWEPDLRVALGKLKARLASALWVSQPGEEPGTWRLIVGPRDQLFAKGLLTIAPASATLDILDIPHLGYVHYLFPGLLTFTVFFSGLLSMGYTMVRYRETLFLKKLATIPLSKRTFIAAQIGPRTLLILLQVLVMVFVAWLVFGLDLSLQALSWMSIISILGLLTSMGIGFIFACLIQTEAMIVDAINAVNIPLVFLSELFFSARVLPVPLPAIAELLPSTVMVRLMREVLLYGTTDMADLSSGLAMLMGWTVATFGLSLYTFRWNTTR